MKKLVFALTLFLFAFLAAEPTANAYPWMIRHGYVQCTTCHADPAGGGLLNPYGRAQGELLLGTKYGFASDLAPGAFAEPLFGLASLPESLLLGGDARFAYLRIMPQGSPAQARTLVMQTDAEGQFSLGRVRANGSIGYVSEGANGAAFTKGVSADPKVVSRLHWIGVDLGKEKEFLVRAGRMNLPFGLRSIEHTRFVRFTTLTNNNDNQTYGLEGDYHHGPWRAGAMLIAGNFAVSPDRFRSRGYAGYGEYALSSTAAIGASSLVTNSEFDLTYLTPTWRHAHGAFARYSPARFAVISAEWNYLFTSRPTPNKNFSGTSGLVSIDLEPVQGVHVGPSYEYSAVNFDAPASHGLWLTAWWFFLPHIDVRADVIAQSLGSPGGTVRTVSAIGQIHGYL